VSDAIAALVNHDFDNALQKLIDSLKADPQYLYGLLKDVCTALFNYLGEDNELTIKYRHLFGRILF
jgi:thioredoxin-like negative regulator of GroEL